MKTLLRVLALLCAVVVLAVGAQLVGAASTGGTTHLIAKPMPTPAPHPPPSVQP